MQQTTWLSPIYRYKQRTQRTTNRGNTMNIATRHALMLAASTTSLASGVYLAARTITEPQPVEQRAILGGIATGSTIVGTHLLNQTATKLITSNAKLGPALIAAGVLAGASGMLMHHTLHP